MAWIESHQALGHHPKTLALAEALHCSLPCAVGYLHFLWWWALDYAQDGIVRAGTQARASRACGWGRAPERFWSALVESGFADLVEGDAGTVTIHDWRDYAGSLIERRTRNRDRMRAARAANPSGPRAAHVQRTFDTRAGLPTNQPDQPVVGPLTESLRSRARAPEAAWTAAAHAPADGVDDDPVQLPNGARQCPLCPEIFSTSYDEHLATSPRHKVRPEPEDFRGKRATSPPERSAPDLPPPNAEALALEHERLLALDRQKHA